MQIDYLDCSGYLALTVQMIIIDFVTRFLPHIFSVNYPISRRYS